MSFELNISETAEDIMGYCGILLSYSKSEYIRRNPGNIYFSNACIFDSKKNQIWYGDIDLTKQRKDIEELVKVLKHDIYVTREQPYRFHGLPDNTDDLLDNGDVIKFVYNDQS